MELEVHVRLSPASGFMHQRGETQVSPKVTRFLKLPASHRIVVEMRRIDKDLWRSFKIQQSFDEFEILLSSIESFRFDVFKFQMHFLEKGLEE